MPGSDKEGIPIPVPSGKRAKDTEDENPEEEERKRKSDIEKSKDDVATDADMKVGDKKKDEEKKEQDLSEEDRQLRDDLDMLVERVTEVPAKNPTQDQITLQKQAIESLRKHIKTSTSSMTSIPKPLKFLRPHYSGLKAYYESLPEKAVNKPYLADVLSILALTLAKDESRETLKYKLLGSGEPVGSWGHEYVRNLAGEIGQEWQQRVTEKKSVDDLSRLVDEIIPFNLSHNAEVEAIDLLMEVEQLDKVRDLVNKDSTHRVARYLITCADYQPDPDEQLKYYGLAYHLYFKHGEYADAIRVALKMNDKDKMTATLQAASDIEVKKQLAYILGSHRITLEAFAEDEVIMEIMGNATLSNKYATLAQELDVKEAKTPEDIYKSHLEEGGHGRRNRAAAATATSGVDSAKQNLASTFVNAFVNAGFGKDLLITPEGGDWLYKNKSHGMLSAAASLGMIMMWDVESGFSAVDRYSYSTQPMIKAGALLATGILSCGVTSEMDAAQALLSEHVESKDVNMKISAVLGLGLAYAGTAREDVLELLMPLIVQEGQSMEVVAITCLALGFVYCGTGNDDISGSIIESFMDRSDTDLKDSTARLMCLGMGLLFLGHAENADGALAALKAISHPISKYLALTVSTCAYTGTNSVLEIQKLLTHLTEHIEEDEKDPMKGMHQEVAVLGIAQIAMGEDLGAEMALRALDHVLQYGEVNVRRVVPLALGLLSVSNPRLTVIETLSKLTHDQDQQVSQNACLALGFLGAGTNNSRISNILRQLATYYAKEPNHLFLVRIAQGLLHMGKGLLTISPFHSDGLLMSKVAVAGLLTVLHASLDLKNTILASRHYLLYCLAPAMRPRMLMTVDESGKSIPVSVKVGQRVDIVAQAGKPKAITGFQTHKTPVLIGAGERAELSNEEYIALSNTLEGFVVVKKNPNYSKE